MIGVNEITPENDSCYSTGDSPMRATVRPELNRGGAGHVCSSFFCCNNGERPRARVVPTRKSRPFNVANCLEACRLQTE
jgi:hypothetical protein